MSKYVFKPYHKDFPLLFEAEKIRIATLVKDQVSKDMLIEHVGSTAVPNLGGKGIIDSALATDQKDWDVVKSALLELGYEFGQAWSTPERWFFKADLPDAQEGTRRYHLHVTFAENSEWKNLLAFRDYLRTHPQDAARYEALKQQAVQEAAQDGVKYRQLKEPMFQEILQKYKGKFMLKIIIFCFLLPLQLIATPHSVPTAKKHALEHYFSGNFEQECGHIISEAINYLKAHEHEFDEQKTIIFDVDDTFLSNIDHVQRTDFCQRCGTDGFLAWVKQAKLPLMPHIKRLYDYCVAHNYHIIFLSNRTSDCYEATVKNLVNHDCRSFKHIILRTESEYHMPSIAYKSGKRALLTQEGFTIVACVGDQVSDFEGGFTGYCVKIPNYLYGASDQYIAIPK